MNVESVPNLFDPARAPYAVTFFDDFVRADGAGSATAGAGAWTGTAINSGTSVILQTKTGGWITLSGAATTDNSGYQLQAPALFAPAAGKTLSFKTRLQASNATEIDIAAGIVTAVDTDILGGVANGFYFLKADDGTTLVARREVGSTETDVTITTAFDTAVHTLGFIVYFNSVSSTTPTGSIHWYYDGALVLQQNDVTLPETTVRLAPAIMAHSGTGSGTISCDFDYVGAAQVR